MYPLPGTVPGIYYRYAAEELLREQEQKKRWDNIPGTKKY